MRSFLIGLVLAFIATPALAKIETSYHEYQVGGETMRGYVAWNSRLESSLGTVIIVHDWDGPNDYEKGRAEQLAALGYTAFAIDVYGKDRQPTSMQENQQRASEMYQNRALFRERLMGAVAEVGNIPGGTENIIAMGYCFGGAAVLEMARAGAGLQGYASFHGGLNLPEGQDYDAVDAPVIVLHGSADPVSGMADVAALLDGLEDAGVSHEAHIYGGARHSFTVPWSGDYLLQADRDSWDALLTFFERNF
ncbi:MAG: dienelactone hdrolase family protein [Idiomarinaceae bacterium HL-53]|nr:MAG: dienelactone hdrolase family protein [Idiomarinaceae bacterium HL-53]CUS48477.1 Dienelactone hydrolase [Idiomarinaceae bacterium HL-53]